MAAISLFRGTGMAAVTSCETQEYNYQIQLPRPCLLA